MTLLKQAEKVTLRDANEDVDKVCIEVKKKLLTTQVENLHAVSHFKYFHAFVSTLNYVSPIGASNDKRR